MYGTKVDFYRLKYDKTTHDSLYGEDNRHGFEMPIPMVMYCKMNSDSLTLSKYGLQTQAEMEAYITIPEFANAVGDPYAYPKAGDVIMMTEAGLDRPGGGGFPYMHTVVDENGVSSCEIIAQDNCQPPDSGTEEDAAASGVPDMTGWLRGPNLYEITEARDDNFSDGLNPMMTHNIWKMKCVRFDNSYQPNAPQEAGQNMVNDSLIYGKLPGGTDPQTPQKTYIGTADKEATEKYWDYNNNLDSVYGDYGGIGSINGNRITPSATDVDYVSAEPIFENGIPFLDTVSAAPHVAEAFHEEMEQPAGKPTHFDIKVRKRFS